MNLALKKYNTKDKDIFEGIEASVKIVKDELEILNVIFRNFDMTDYLNGTPREKLACLNRAVEYVQITDDLEKRFMANVKRMKSAFNICSSSDDFTEEESIVEGIQGIFRSLPDEKIYMGLMDEEEKRRVLAEMRSDEGKGIIRDMFL